MTKETLTKNEVLYLYVKNFFNEMIAGKLTVNTVTVLTRYSMEYVQQNWKELKGSEKKELVMSVITDFIKNLLNDKEVVGNALTNEIKEQVLVAVDMIPTLIDTTVDFAKSYKVKLRKRCF